MSDPKKYPGWDEMYDVVDREDRVIGTAMRSEVHANPALTHRAVHILVFRSNGCLLMQKRLPDKDVAPDKWDTSVGGHVDSGEDYLTAALREMAEELGLSGLPIEHLYDFRYECERETEQIRTYRCSYDGPVKFETFEISEVRDWTEDEIAKAIGQGVFTRNFEEDWRRYLQWRKGREG